MQSAVWGPFAWNTMHAAVDALREDKPGGTAALLWSFGRILPCGKCRLNYKSFLMYAIQHERNVRLSPATANDPSLICRPRAVLWHVHDLVNRKLGKCRVPLSSLLRRGDPDPDWWKEQAFWFLIFVAYNQERNPDKISYDQVVEFVHLLLVVTLNPASSPSYGLHIQLAPLRAAAYAATHKAMYRTRSLQLTPSSVELVLSAFSFDDSILHDEAAKYRKSLVKYEA